MIAKILAIENCIPSFVWSSRQILTIFFFINYSIISFNFPIIMIFKFEIKIMI